MTVRWLALAVALSSLSVPLSAQLPPLARLDTLRVEVASRIASGFPARSRVVQVLTEEDLRLLPVRTVAEALRWMTAADLQSRSPAQADLSFRGSTFEQVLVLVDGVRMSDPQTGHFDLDLAVPLDRVARIEVLEGPASALYGADALGGVVNVVTREGGTRASGWFERGAFDTWRTPSEGHACNSYFDSSWIHHAARSWRRQGQLPCIFATRRPLVSVWVGGQIVGLHVEVRGPRPQARARNRVCQEPSPFHVPTHSDRLRE